MKSQTKKEMTIKTKGELEKLLTDARGDLLQMQLDLRQNKLHNTRGIFMKKKEIAALQTFLHAKA